jgi:multiple RNA-binding domain-containing protein 1
MDINPPQDPAKETILRTHRLFLRNLAFSCTETDLLELFGPFGDVSQVSQWLSLFYLRRFRTLPVTG